jgi:hypothetical protein
MMNGGCKKVKASIDESMLRASGQSQKDTADEHLRRCAARREYLNVAHREDLDLVDCFGSIEQIERKAMQVLKVRGSQKPENPNRI